MKKPIAIHLLYLSIIAGILFWQNWERQKLLSQIETEFSPRIEGAMRLLDLGQRAVSSVAKATALAYRTPENQSLFKKIDLLANYSTDCREIAEEEADPTGLNWAGFLKKTGNLSDSTMMIAGDDLDFAKIAVYKKTIEPDLSIKTKAAKSLILLALQTDIFYANLAILKNVNACGDIRFDQFEPLVELQNGNPNVGEKYAASIFLIPAPMVAFNFKKVEIEVDGHKIPQINGLGLYETRFDKAGKTTIKVAIKTIDPVTGEVRNYWKEQVIDVLP